MTRQIADVLKEKLQGLNFLDKVAGLVQTIERAQPTEIETAFVVTKFPASADVNFEECFRNGCYKDLVPNSKNKGVLYFESNGTRPLSNDRGNHSYQTNLRCIVWINNKKIQQSDNCKSISHQLITYIRKSLEIGYFNEGDFTKIHVKASNIIENEYSIFNRYTYPQEVLKYLFWPYEAFAIDLVVTYNIGINCIPEFELNPETCTT